MAQPDLSSRRMIALGVIRKAIGVDGLCAVGVYGNTLRQLGLPATVYVGVSETDCIRMVLEKIEFRPKGPVCLFAGIHGPEGIESLRGLFIYTDEASLPRLEEGNFYHFELTGLKVQTDQGHQIGTLVQVHNFPTVDSVEVKRPSGETIMIPLTSEVLVDIDRTSGYFTVSHSFIEELL